MKILVVDDNEDARVLVETILESRGHSIESAENGIKALDMARSRRPDLIISDIMMPEMDGFELCSAVKEDEELKDIPVVLVTVTYIDPDDEKLAKSVGASRFIIKPVDRECYVAIIDEVIETFKKPELTVSEKPRISKEKLDRLHYRSVATKLWNNARNLDITNRKLNESETKYRTLVESTRTVPWTLDLRSGCFTYIGKQVEALLGYPTDSWIDINTWAERIHHDDRKEAVSFCKANTNRGEDHDFEYRAITADGRTVWIRDFVTVVMGEQGADELVGFMFDITDRKLAAETVVRAATEWRDTFDAITDFVTVIDTDYKILKVNKAFADFVKKHPKDIIGEKCYELLHNTTEPVEGCPHLEMMKTQKAIINEVFEPRSGQYLMISDSPIFENGKLTASVHFAKDITEQKTLKEQLLHAQKMESIGTLAGGIAHDFNNILNAIQGYTYLVRVKMAEGEDVATDLDEVTQASQRAADLIRQILMFSRNDSAEFQPVQLAPIMKEALKLLRATIPATIEIRDNITPTGNVLADSVQIHQILMNLCTNAYHAMQESGGVLEVDLQQLNISPELASMNIGLQPGLHAVLRVSDTGKGIDQSVIDRIFEPYYTTKEKGKGTGLGLSVVHGLVRNYGGTITVSSSPGMATAFTIYIPVVKIEAKQEKKSDGTVLAGSGNILFVDDEVSIVIIGREILGRMGYTVTGSTDSTKALAMFRESPDKFDLLITDWTMPKMTGMKLAEEIINVRPDIPIILISGYNEGINEEIVKQAGIKTFLKKPVTPEKLSETVYSILEKARHKEYS